MFKKVEFGKITICTPFFSEDGKYIDIPLQNTSEFLNDKAKAGVNIHFASSLFAVGLVSGKQEIRNDITTSELLPGVYRYFSGTPSMPEGLVPLDQDKDTSTAETLDVIKEFEEEINWFKTSDEVYKEMKNTRKSRGILLYGKPGMGKSFLIRKVVRELLQDSIVIYFDGEDLPSIFLVEALNKLPEMKTVIFEEFANVFSGMNDLSYILEFLDGSKSMRNCLSIMTTNHPEKIPQNVLRHGRVDLLVEVNVLSAQDIKNLMKFYNVPEADYQIEDLAKLSVVELKEVVMIAKRFSISIKKAIKKVETRSKLIERNFTKVTKEIGLSY